jgi:uncharacterized protein DUF1569
MYRRLSSLRIFRVCGGGADCSVCSTLTMKTLGNESDRNAVLGRLRRIQPDSQRRWGKMTPHQMVCHLNDSFKSVIGERDVSVRQTNALARTLIRWIALYAPFKWPHGVPTMPENDQERGGTPPEDFKRDVDALASMIERLTGAQKDFQWRRHPLFDQMSERDWLRWGYLHVDHHLRQFGL